MQPTLLTNVVTVIAVLMGGGMTSVLAAAGGGVVALRLDLGVAFAMLNWAGIRALPAAAAALIGLYAMQSDASSTLAPLAQTLILLATIVAGLHLTRRTGASGPPTATSWVHTLIFVAPLTAMVGAGLSLVLIDERTAALSSLTHDLGLQAGSIGFGLIATTPLMLLFPGPHALHTSNRGLIAATTGVFLLFSVTVYFHLCINARDRAAEDLASRTEHAAYKIQQDLNTYITALRGVEALFASSAEVTREEFETFSGSLQKPLPGLYAVAWDAYVPAAERENFVASMRATGLPDFEIFEVVDGKRQIAPERPYYVPVAFARYEGAPLNALGYDMASEPTRAAALQQALFRGEPVASGRIKLVTDPDPHYDILVLMTMRGATRSDELIGYAGLAVRISQIMRAATGDVPDAILSRLYDRSAAPGSAWLFGAPEDYVPDPMAIQHSTVFDIAGRRWEIQMIAPPRFVTAHVPLGAALVLWLGLLASAAVSLVLTIFEDTYRRQTGPADDYRDTPPPA